MDATRPGQAKGREDVLGWASSQPESFYEADTHLQQTLRVHAGAAGLDRMVEDLRRFGQELSGQVDALARVNNLDRNLPQLERYSPHGERLEAIAHHPSYHQIGRIIYGSGVMEAYAQGPNMVGALARFYLSCFNGEAGHNCPLACTAGVIRVLQELGSPQLKARFLPGLLNRDYDHHLEGAQFLTEIQGGSDVGQNATEATLDDQGWRVTGEKWFCSNIDADVFLMTARLPSGPEGTRGLGLFLVPRRLEDGSLNAFFIRRLKDKLGTRSMASGECDFLGARAYHMGEVGQGFKHMMGLVINVSRLYNAVGCSGAARRAFLDAQRYARHRRAFGQPIIEYPLVQETLANMRSTIDAMTSGCFYLAALQDEVDRGAASQDDATFLRMAINLNKLVTAKRARWAVTEGIEILGGNGAIETFSVMPRLLRDMIVFENWEGTHNTLLAQTLRDMQRAQAHEPFMRHLSELIQALSPAWGLSPLMEQAGQRLDHVLRQPAASASLAWRPLAEHLCELLYAAVFARQLEASAQPLSSLGAKSLTHFIQTCLRAQRPHEDPDYVARLGVLARAS